MPKISVIIPVFNAERYVRRCLDSIISQTFSDYEAILINDGSKDNSLSILEEYAKYDSRFVIIDKPNGGVSSARQAGLDQAKGEYVIHADPDDYVSPHWLERLHNKIISEQSDMVMCDYMRIMKSKKIICHQKPTKLDSHQVIEDILMGRLWGVTWNKLVRKECITRNHISFDLNVGLWEDVLFNCLLLNSEIKVSYIPELLYYYDSTSNDNSIVLGYKPKDVNSMVYVIQKLEQELNSSYQECIDFAKSRTKYRVFITKPYDGERYVNTFKEINEKMIQDANNHPLSIRKILYALCLKRHHWIGRIISTCRHENNL